MKTALPKEYKVLEQQIGEFLEFWGFKKIHGRIWTHLYLSSVPLDTSELIRRLRISKALMSISLKELLKYDVIREAEKGPYGSVLYAANPEPLSVIFTVLRTRELEMLRRIRASFKAVNDLPKESHDRLCIDLARRASLGELIQSAEGLLEFALERDPAENLAWATSLPSGSVS